MDLPDLICYKCTRAGEISAATSEGCYRIAHSIGCLYRSDSGRGQLPCATLDFARKWPRRRPRTREAHRTPAPLPLAKPATPPNEGAVAKSRRPLRGRARVANRRAAGTAGTWRQNACDGMPSDSGRARRAEHTRAAADGGETRQS